MIPTCVERPSWRDRLHRGEPGSDLRAYTAQHRPRRRELAKVAHKYAEHARVAVRNVRREGMDLLKRLDKDGDMGEDEHHKNSTKVQELTDKLIKDIDQALAAKEAEIKQV